MNTANLLTRLEAEGVTVALNLKLEADSKPSDETLNLIKENRHALVAYLKKTDNHANGNNCSHLHLPGIIVHSLMIWLAKYHELRLELPPNTVILDAQPQQVVEAFKVHPWGVVYDPERYVLMTWGDVPPSALMDKRDLETGELLIAEQVAA